MFLYFGMFFFSNSGVTEGFVAKNSKHPKTTQKQTSVQQLTGKMWTKRSLIIALSIVSCFITPTWKKKTHTWMTIVRLVLTGWCVKYHHRHKMKSAKTLLATYAATAKYFFFAAVWAACIEWTGRHIVSKWTCSSLSPNLALLLLLARHSSSMVVDSSLCSVLPHITARWHFKSSCQGCWYWINRDQEVAVTVATDGHARINV